MGKYFPFELTTDYSSRKITTPDYLQTKANEAVDRKCVFTQKELKTFMNLRDDKNITFPAYLFVAGYSLPISMLSVLENLLPQLHFPFLPLQIARLGYIYSIDEIKELNHLQYSEAASVLEYQMNHQDKYPTANELIYINLKNDTFGDGIAHHLAKRLALDYFSVDDIIALGKHRTGYSSISHILAQRGRQFTVEEIEKLKNPIDDYGATLAHRVAFSHKDLFQISDLLKPTFQQKIFFDHLVFYDGSTGGNYSVNDCDMYDDKFRLTHQGATVAHIMAREGHQFTTEEISLLGDPVDDYGLSLSAWQNNHAACIELINQLYKNNRL